MTKDVLISIKGLQLMETEGGGEEPIEVITPASYFCKNGKHYILYEEVAEGIPGVTKNKVKITGDSLVEIMKTGLTNTHMVFEKNKSSITYYDTPFGQLLMGICTTDVEIEETENEIKADIWYELEVNHERLASCHVQMNIKSKKDTRLY